MTTTSKRSLVPVLDILDNSLVLQEEQPLPGASRSATPALLRVTLYTNPILRHGFTGFRHINVDIHSGTRLSIVTNFSLRQFMALLKDIQFSYDDLDGFFGKALGTEYPDFTCALYNGDFTLTLDE